MEPWQKSHIKRNLYELQLKTEYNASLRAVLIEQNILSDEDISDLDAASNKGRIKASALLYSILIKCTEGYNALMDACEAAEQSGAHHILKQARPDGPIVCFQPRHINDCTTWDMLSEDLKNEMRNKLVGFQEKKVKLSECCNGLEQHIDGKFLRELVKGNTPTLVNNQVPDPVEYYVDRTLRSRSKLKSSVFQQPGNDVFVVKGIEKYQLTSLVAGAETDVSGNQTERLTARYIHWECEEDFESICELAESPVHLIRHECSVFEWVKSSGSVKNLQKYVDDAQDCFPEGQLASRGNRVNVIPDSPGMGKTLLLANIAHQISKNNPNMLIRFIVMKDLVQTLSEEEINLESILSCIAKKSSEFECGQKIVKQILTTEPCILMFDGFDEVLLDQIATAKKILEAIVTLKLAQVFVTTRPHLREELENSLHALGYTINPFMEADQVKFLYRFWELNVATANENLQEFSKSCVKTISTTMTDFERDIAGIPLQCRLLAETYTKQAIKCSKQGFYDKNSEPIVQITSIFEMYERHMKMRLENFKSQEEEVKRVHVYYALESLFCKQAHQFQELKESSFSSNELCAMGFLEATKSEDIRFVHRTFAEFFVAWFAVKMTWPEKITPFLLNELLSTKSNREFIATPFGKADLGISHTFNNPVIAYFVNGFKKIHAKNLKDEDLSRQVSLLLDSVYFSQVSNILIACAVSDYLYVPLLVSFCFDLSQLDEKGVSEISQLLHISAKYSNVRLMKSFCSQRTYLKCPAKSDSFIITPLHVAVQRGHYELVEFLLPKYETGLTNLPYLLHFCVFESLAESKKIIADKVEIIKLLSNKNKTWIDEKRRDGTVPLLQKNVNSELIKCLIECGVDVNTYDWKGNTILHKITENPVTPKFYDWLVVTLSKHEFKYFNHSNREKVSPLHCASETVEMLENTLKYFQSNRADFNAEDNNGEVPLFYAIRGGRSVALICALIALDADWKKRNKRRETVLHVCAKHAHYSAMEYFSETLKLDVNAKDKNGNTPLHFSVLGRSEIHESMQRLLITGGADVNAKTWKCSMERYERETMISHIVNTYKLSAPFTEFNKNTPFVDALRLRKGLNLSIIELMIQHGLSVDASEALIDLLFNSNIMSWEIDNEYARVLQFLIERGGRIEYNPWDSEEVMKNLHAIIQSTDMACLWPALETSGLFTESELQDIHLLSNESFDKCERFYKAVETKPGSFERVCILLINSNQIRAISLLRRSIATQEKEKLLVTPPPFTSQFIHSQQNSSLSTMALVTTNPFLTIRRIRDMIRESVVEIREADISSYLQKAGLEELIVVKVPVLTAEIIRRLEASGSTKGKIIFVCSAVSENVENCHVVTDTLLTWSDIALQHFRVRTEISLFNGKCSPIQVLFKTPLILSKLSQIHLGKKFPVIHCSILKSKTGHIDMESQSKSYLCPIFRYVIPDKFVFIGISIEKLKEFARFGHKIGYFGEYDVDNFDFVLIEQSHQFDEICQQISKNVHLIEYEQEKEVFKLVKTWGWKQNLQSILKQQPCERFPHCECVPSSKSLVVALLLEYQSFGLNHRFDCLLPINEITPTTLKLMTLEHSEELFNLNALLKRMCAELQINQIDFTDKSPGEEIVQLVTEHLSTLLVENELHHVAITTLFPNLTKQTNVTNSLEKYQQLKMLKQIDNNKIVFVDQSLAWYFIAKLLMGLSETTEFEEITTALRKQLFQSCFQSTSVKLMNGYYEQPLQLKADSREHQLISYNFVNIMFFRFIDAFLKQSLEKDKSGISSLLRSIVAAEMNEHKWISACVNAKLLYLLQLILSFEIETKSSEFELEALVVLSVIYADVPITRLVADQFEKKLEGKLTKIKIFFHKKEISLMSLAAFKGNYGEVEYLFNHKGFKHSLKKHNKLGEVVNYCVEHTANNLGYKVNERKRILDLLLRTDMTLLKQICLSSWIHVDLICYLINIGLEIHAKDYNGNNILHLCPVYLTSHQYHKVVSIIHANDKTDIAKLFKDFGFNGETAFHVAVKHLELLDETMALFSESGVNFNALNKDQNSVFVHAAKSFRSARLLDALYRFDADIHATDNKGRPASVYCKNNLTALRYLSSRGVSIDDTDDEDESDEAPSSDSY